MIVLVPAAGHRASTDDRTNRFKIPEIYTLLESLENEDVNFKSLEEIETCLLPQLDRLHNNFITLRLGELK